MIIIDLDDVYSTIQVGDTKDLNNILSALKKELNVRVPGAEYLYAVKSGQWDGTVNLWTNEPNSNRIKFRTGLVPRVWKALEARGFTFQVGFNLLGTRALTNYNFQPTLVALRRYQQEAYSTALQNNFGPIGWWPRGVIEVATGGGKTEIAVAMYETNPLRTFFLVHRKDLLLQAKERFEKYGHRPGIMGAGHWKPDGQLNIATLQTISSVFDGDPASIKFKQLAVLLNDCEQIFVDECHLAASTLDKGNDFVRIIDLFAHATFRWGLTATPFLRSTYDNMLLEGVTGTSLYTISTEQLVNQGFLTKPKVIMKTVPGEMPIKFDWRNAQSAKKRAEHWRAIEDRGIKYNVVRTKLIIDEICAGPYPCLVLVKTVDQATFLAGMYHQTTGNHLPFLSGASSAIERREAVKKLNDGTIPVVMATTIFDEGVDIPNLAKVILASGGKSQVKLIQRVGRALRPAPGKKEAIIVDFADKHHSMLEKHADERRRVWASQAFEVVNA